MEVLVFASLQFYFSDFLFKFLVIGSAGTGKSCLLHQFIEGKCKLNIVHIYFLLVCVYFAYINVHTHLCMYSIKSISLSCVVVALI